MYRMVEKECYDGPITGNSKCVVISIFLAIFYWYAPPKNKWILLFILYTTYLGIAWYDEYLCERVLTPSYLRHFYEWAKPRKSMQSKEYKNLCPEPARKILIVDAILALLGLLFLPYFLKWNPK